MSSLQKILVFDFDGVLVDSNEMKYQAWFQLFPDKQDFMRETLSTMYYTTRFDILRHVFQTIALSGGEQEQKVKEYAIKYNDIVQQGILRLGLIPGVYKALEVLSRRYRLYINSGTIEEPLRASVRDLGISVFFVSVFGAPRTKAENLARVMYKEKVLSREVVMIGDGEPDYRAAQQYNMCFIGVTNAWNGWKEKEFPLVPHIAEVSLAIRMHCVHRQRPNK